VRALHDPAGFVAGLSRTGEVADLLARQLASRRELSRAELLDQWQDGFAGLVRALAATVPGTRIPWYGPPMGAASFATARLMEYWAHGQDVADAMHVEGAPTARLRHICHLGRRRHRADTGLVATGAAADDWLDVAQCFAGPPGAGRARRATSS
jgi:uncharacterized protein (TIGR03084 family)